MFLYPGGSLVGSGADEADFVYEDAEDLAQGKIMFWITGKILDPVLRLAIGDIKQRKSIKVRPSCGGTRCPSTDSSQQKRTRSCYSGCCRVNCLWTWNPWSPCRGCGTSRQTRSIRISVKKPQLWRNGLSEEAERNATLLHWSVSCCFSALLTFSRKFYSTPFLNACYTRATRIDNKELLAGFLLPRTNTQATAMTAPLL